MQAKFFLKLLQFETERQSTCEGFINSVKFIWIDRDFNDFGDPDEEVKDNYVKELQSYGFSYIECFNDIKPACEAIRDRLQANNIIIISSGSILEEDPGLIEVLTSDV